MIWAKVESLIDLKEKEIGFVYLVALSNLTLRISKIVNPTSIID
jgi:hypothetical protein